MKLLKCIAVFCVVVVACVFSCSLFGSNFQVVVEDRVFRSAQPSGAKLEKYIRKHQIKTIINLRGENEGKEWYETEKAVASRNHVEFHDLRFEAFTLPRVLLLDPIVDTLQRAERALLIHCHSGVDRAGLVSALALALELDPPISVLKDQLPGNPLIGPPENSVGVLFFSSYEKWLQETGVDHNADRLLFFIEQEYVDGHGNMEYTIETVQDVIFTAETKDSKRTATIKRTPDPITLRGWAFHARSKGPVDDLFVVIDHTLARKAEFVAFRSDVMEAYGLDKKDLENNRLGWAAEFEGKAISLGWHDVSLRRVNARLGQFEIATDVRLCVKP